MFVIRVLIYKVIHNKNEGPHAQWSYTREGAKIARLCVGRHSVLDAIRSRSVELHRARPFGHHGIRSLNIAPPRGRHNRWTSYAACIHGSNLKQNDKDASATGCAGRAARVGKRKRSLTHGYFTIVKDRSRNGSQVNPRVGGSPARSGSAPRPTPHPIDSMMRDPNGPKALLSPRSPRLGQGGSVHDTEPLRKTLRVCCVCVCACVRAG